MKISVIEPSGGLYGSEFCLMDLIEELVSCHEWEIFLPRGAPLLTHLEDLPVTSRPLMPSGECGSRSARLIFYLHLGFQWLCHRPDLVYVNQAGVIRPIALLCRWLRIPVVCQVQTLEDARWVNQNIRQTSAVRSFLCNSRFIARGLQIDESLTSILYQGYRWKNLQPHSGQDAGDADYTVGLLGRISESKGHYLLLDAARLLVDEAVGDGEDDWRFVLIGDAKTPEEREHFEAALDESGIGNRFELRGYRSEIGPELARLDALVIPSLAEPLGRILFEAAECGLPVVCSDAGGLGEVSRHFGFGLRFRTGDAVHLAERLQALRMQTAQENQTQGQSGASMLKRLDLPAYAKVVEEILSKSSRGCETSQTFFGLPETTASKEFPTTSDSRLPELLFLSNLPYTRHGGGNFVVSASVFDQIDRHSAKGGQAQYKTIPLDSHMWATLGSKIRRRILKKPSSIPAFSPDALNRRGRKISQLLTNDQITPFFKGVTPWVGWQPDRPYFLYTDVAFATLLENQDAASLFRESDIKRILDEEARFLAGATGIFFESRWGLEKTIDTYGLDDGNAFVAGRAGLFSVQPEDRWDGRSRELLFIAKHFHQKGGDLVHASFLKLREKHPELRWRIIGGEPDRAVLRTPGVIYEGFLDPENHRDRERFVRILRNAFLLVHPTREDTNPLVITEAACFGCPSVSVDHFAIPDLIDDGRSGMLLPWPPHPEMLTEAVDHLINRPAAYKSMRAAAMEKARENGDWDSIGKQFMRRVSELVFSAKPG